MLQYARFRESLRLLCWDFFLLYCRTILKAFKSSQSQDSWKGEVCSYLKWNWEPLSIPWDENIVTWCFGMSSFTQDQKTERQPQSTASQNIMQYLQVMNFPKPPNEHGPQNVVTPKYVIQRRLNLELNLTSNEGTLEDSFFLVSVRLRYSYWYKIYPETARQMSERKHRYFKKTKKKKTQKENDRVTGEFCCVACV